MNIFLYIIIFISGAFFGSFYTLAVYRIPRNIDIVKTHSYCPNCNHKLGFFDLFPILSYIFLGGKCRYCGQKIRPRYLILEILSGLLFVAFALFLKLDINTIDIHFLIKFALFALYASGIILIAGIDKEYKQIDRRVLAYSVIISTLYMIYLYTIDTSSIYRYAIYLVIYFILLIIDLIILRKKAQSSYIVNLLILLMVILSSTNLEIFLYTIIITALALVLHFVLRKIRKIKIKEEDKKIPIVFFICSSNGLAYLIALILSMFA